MSFGIPIDAIPTEGGAISPQPEYQAAGQGGAPRLSLPNSFNALATEQERHIGDKLRPVERIRAKANGVKLAERDRQSSINNASIESIALDIKKTQDALTESDTRFNDIWSRITAMSIPSRKVGTDPTTGESIAGLVYGLFGGDWTESGSLVKGLHDVRVESERQDAIERMQLMRQNLLMMAENELDNRRFLRGQSAGLQAEARAGERRIEDRQWQQQDADLAYERQLSFQRAGLDAAVAEREAAQAFQVRLAGIEFADREKSLRLQAELERAARGDADKLNKGNTLLSAVLGSISEDTAHSSISAMRSLGLNVSNEFEQAMVDIVKSNAKKYADASALETRAADSRDREISIRGSIARGGSGGSGNNPDFAPFNPIGTSRTGVDGVPTAYRGVAGLDPSVKGPVDPPSIVKAVGKHLTDIGEPPVNKALSSARSKATEARFAVTSAQQSYLSAKAAVKDARSPADKRTAEALVAKAKTALDKAQTKLRMAVNDLTSAEKGSPGYAAWLEDFRNGSLLLIRHIGNLGLDKATTEARRDEVRRAYMERTGRNDIK